MDLIDRQVAIDALEEYLDRLQIVNWQENPGVPYKVHGLNWAVNTIRELPSAQPEIVRCKDCKHRPDGTGANHDLEFPDYKCPCQCEDFWYSWMPKDDWFCANGERRDDAEVHK